MFDLIKEHMLVVVSGLLSIGLFGLFISLHIKNSKFLTIDSKWLLISGLPILIALIVGGYIHKFKGFGIELETSLKNPIGQVNLIATDVLESISGRDKGSISSVEKLPSSELIKYHRLSFVNGKRNYYDEYIFCEDYPISGETSDLIDHIVDDFYYFVHWIQLVPECLATSEPEHCIWGTQQDDEIHPQIPIFNIVQITF